MVAEHTAPSELSTLVDELVVGAIGRNFPEFGRGARFRMFLVAKIASDLDFMSDIS